jgi:hypothetical protein
VYAFSTFSPSFSLLRKVFPNLGVAEYRKHRPRSIEQSGKNGESEVYPL